MVKVTLSNGKKIDVKVKEYSFRQKQKIRNTVLNDVSIKSRNGREEVEVPYSQMLNAIELELKAGIDWDSMPKGITKQNFMDKLTSSSADKLLTAIRNANALSREDKKKSE